MPSNKMTASTAGKTLNGVRWESNLPLVRHPKSLSLRLTSKNRNPLQQLPQLRHRSPQRECRNNPRLDRFRECLTRGCQCRDFPVPDFRPSSQEWFRECPPDIRCLRVRCPECPCRGCRPNIRECQCPGCLSHQINRVSRCRCQGQESLSQGDFLRGHRSRGPLFPSRPPHAQLPRSPLALLRGQMLPPTRLHPNRMLLSPRWTIWIFSRHLLM